MMKLRINPVVAEDLKSIKDFIAEDSGNNLIIWRLSMETMYYVVVNIDGDYVNLQRTDVESSDLKLVARALLPENITEGSRLKYEMLQYELIE